MPIPLLADSRGIRRTRRTSPGRCKAQMPEMRLARAVAPAWMLRAWNLNRNRATDTNSRRSVPMFGLLSHDQFSAGICI
jgi:hypothetical protein